MELNHEQSVEEPSPSQRNREQSVEEPSPSHRNREQSVEAPSPSPRSFAGTHENWTPLMKFMRERNPSITPAVSRSSFGSRSSLGASSLSSKSRVTPVRRNDSPVCPWTPAKPPRVARAAKDELETRKEKGVFAYRPNPYFERLVPDYYEYATQSRGFPDMDYPPLGTDGALRIEKDFVLISNLGSGTLATVYEYLNRVEGCLYAIKIVRCDPNGDRWRNRQCLIEVQALASLGVHDNIVRYYNSFYENEILHIQLELCDYNLRAVNLENESFTSQKALLNMIYQIGLALEFIHRRGIVHMAVSPKKIYIAKSNFKLGGFRYAARKDKLRDIKTMGLDKRYTAPEILNEELDPRQLDTKLIDRADIYSLGTTVYERVRGFSAQHAYSHSFEQLVTAMMHPLPSSRPTAKALLETLRKDFNIRSATPILSSVHEEE